MSKRVVKKYEASLKAKIVLEAIKEEKTIAQIGSDHNISPTNIRDWKKIFLDNIEKPFKQEKQANTLKNKIQDNEKTIDELHRQIGELTAKLNWAKKKSREAGIQYEEIIN